MISATAPKQTRNSRYDEHLLVRLIAEGQLSYRKIAEQVGVSAMTVSNVSRGRRRRDLYERICCTVEDAHRRAHRLASSYLLPLVAAHVKEAIEGTGETARKCREFLIRTFMNRPDPAGRYIGHPAAPTGRARPATRGELDLLSALRGDRTAPKYRDLPKRIRHHVRVLVDDGQTPNSQNSKKPEPDAQDAAPAAKDWPPFHKLPSGPVPHDHPLRDSMAGLPTYGADLIFALFAQFNRDNEDAGPDADPDGRAARGLTDDQAARVADVVANFSQDDPPACKAQLAELYKTIQATRAADAAAEQNTEQEKAESP